MDENRRVLAVDDDLGILETYRMILAPGKVNGLGSLRQFAGAQEREGTTEFFALTTATQGAEAVVAVRQAVAAERPFAVVFLDMRMPPGIDGLDTARRIREIDDRVYIIVVTAYSDHDINEIQMAARHDVVLARKPLTEEEVLQLARNACNSWDQDEVIRMREKHLMRHVGHLDAARWLLLELVNNIAQGVILCTAQGTVTSFNPAALRMLQYPRSELRLRKIRHFFAEGDMDKLLQELLEQGRIHNVPRTLVTYDGDKLPVQLTAAVLHDPQGSVRNLAFVVHDLTCQV